MSEELNLTKHEIEILIAESAMSSFTLHVARTRRIAERANADYTDAIMVLNSMEAKLQALRDVYLRGAM